MKKRRGFTLIELMVVVAIMGILSAVIMTSLSGARAKARDGKRVTDIKQIQLALSLYYTDYGFYPINMYIAVTSGSLTTPGLAPTYLPTVPTDPSQGTVACTNGLQASCYKYTSYKSGVGATCNSAATAPVLYHVGATLEDMNNNALTQDADMADTLSGFGACTTSGPGTFHGLSAGTTCGSTAGTAQPGGTETCYDFRP